MGTKSTHKDPRTGRIVIEEEEGNRETRFSPPLNCASDAEFVEKWSTLVGDFIEGQLEVSATVQSHGSAEWSAIEVRVVGYLGSIANVCGTWMLGGSKTTLRLPLEQGDTYDRIGIEARAVVNGGAPGALAPLQASLVAALKLWS